MRSEVDRCCPWLLQKWVVLLVLIATYQMSTAVTAAELSLDFLLDLNADWSRSHQAAPMGVPRDYDWVAKPRLEAGNHPDKFAAFTGWGHVFWSKESIGHPGELQVRNFNTFVCGGPDRGWVHAQRAGIEGAEFRADFKGNAAKRPVKIALDGNSATVLFDAGSTFHFWPSSGRRRLPEGGLCGFVVLLEARSGLTQPGASPRSGGYLIGLGADYWIDMSSPWDNYRTNKGVGLGRLKYVGDQWSWFGMSTASDQDLRRLYASGLLNNIR